jgi:DNA-binding MarR family transcriptional regulator
MILHRVFVVGPIRISELARSLGLDKSTISRQLEPLRTARLLDEEPDATNRRASKVSLSVRGRQLIDRIAESNIDYWESVLDHLSVTEQRQLARLLGRLRQAIDAQDVVLHRQAEEQRWSGRET